MARKRSAPSGAGLGGTPSANRTDKMAVQTPTGLPYGEAGQLASAQSAVPIPATPPPSPPPGGGVPAGSNPPPGGIEALLAAAQQMPPPSGPGLSAPTQRPNESVTAGLASGAGPGPEAIPALNKPPSPLAQTLAAAANATGSGLLANLAAQAAAQ